MARAVSNPNPAVEYFNKKAIEDWKAKLETIPKEIEKENNEILKANEQIALLQSIIHDIETVDIEPIQRRIDALQAKMDLFKLPAKIEEKANEIRELRDTLESVNKSLEELKNTLAVIVENSQKNQRIRQIRQKMEQIEEASLRCKEASSELNTLHTWISECEHKMSDASLDIIAVQNQLTKLLDEERQSALNHYKSSGAQSNFHSSNSGQYSSVQHRDVASDNLRKEKIKQLEQRLDNLNKTHKIQHDLRAQRKAEYKAAEKKLNRNEDIISQNRAFIEQSLDNEKSIARYRTLKQCDDEVAAVEIRRASLVLEQDKLKEKLLDCQTKKLEVQKKYDKLHEKRLKCEEASRDYREEKNPSVIQSKLAEEEKLRRPHLKKRDELNDKQTIFRSQVAAHERAIRSAQVLENDLNKNYFANDYCFQPQKLFEKTIQLLKSNLNDFCVSHAYGLQPSVRLAIANLLCYVNMLAEHIATETPDSNGEKYRQKYAELCGLIYKVIREAKHDDFANVLRAVISYENTGREKPVAFDYKEADKAFESYRSLGDLQWLELNQLRDYEQKEYLTSKHELRQLMNKFPQNNKVLQKVKKATDNMIKAFDEQERLPGFDYHYHTFALIKSNQWMQNSLSNKNHAEFMQIVDQNPSSKEYHTEFNQILDQNPHQRSSRGKRVMGACLFFAGVIVAAAAVIASVLTAGTALEITVPVAAAGVSLVASGIGLFVSGREKGERKEMKNYRDAACEYTLEPGIRS